MTTARPNYFIGVQLLFASPIQQAGLNSLYEELKSRNRNIGRILSNPNKLHITLALLNIEENRVSEAANVFQASADGMRSLLRDNHALSFRKVNAFGRKNQRNVLWLESHRDQTHDALMNYCVYISEFFAARNFDSRPSDVLHATIANKYSRKIKITESDYLDLDSFVAAFSPIVCTEIDLLKIGSTDSTNGYYQSYSKLYIDDSIRDAEVNFDMEGPVYDEKDDITA
eukprot:gene30510-39763_t